MSEARSPERGEEGETCTCPDCLPYGVCDTCGEDADRCDPVTPEEPEMPCGLCGLSMSRNPHPEAGAPAGVSEVGPVWACIPCIVASRRRATRARYAAERRVEELEEERGRLRETLVRIAGPDLHRERRCGDTDWCGCERREAAAALAPLPAPTAAE